MDIYRRGSLSSIDPSSLNTSATASWHSLSDSETRQEPLGQDTAAQADSFVAECQNAALTGEQRFRCYIDGNDESGLRGLLSRMQTGARYQLVNSPLSDDDAITSPMPRLPLSRAAAQGDVGVVIALFDLGPAVGLLADNYPGALQLTAAYWAAAYGQCDVLDVLDARGCAPVSQVVLACHQGAHIGILKWACEHGASPEQFQEALELAVEAEPARLNDIHNLVRVAGAKTDVAFAQLTHQSLLYTAIERGHLSSARTLLALGASPDFDPTNFEGQRANPNNIRLQVVSLALRRGYYALVGELFAHGARKESDYLRVALELAPNPLKGYIALLHSGVLPDDDTQAAGFERICIHAGLTDLAGLVSTQRIGIHLVMRAKSQDDKKRQASAARERTEAHAAALFDVHEVTPAFCSSVSLFVADASLEPKAKRNDSASGLGSGSKRTPVWERLRHKILPQSRESASPDALSGALVTRKRGLGRRA